MMRIVALLIFGSMLAACSGSSRIGSRGTTETIKHQQRHGDAASPHPGAIPADARARSALRHSPLYRDLAIDAKGLFTVSGGNEQQRHCEHQQRQAREQRACLANTD